MRKIVFLVLEKLLAHFVKDNNEDNNKKYSYRDYYCCDHYKNEYISEYDVHRRYEYYVYRER